jgi:hypothetical protein
MYHWLINGLQMAKKLPCLFLVKRSCPFVKYPAPPLITEVSGNYMSTAISGTSLPTIIFWEVWCISIEMIGGVFGLGYQFLKINNH